MLLIHMKRPHLLHEIKSGSDRSMAPSRSNTLNLSYIGVVYVLQFSPLFDK